MRSGGAEGRRSKIPLKLHSKRDQILGRRPSPKLRMAIQSRLDPLYKSNPGIFGWSRRGYLKIDLSTMLFNESSRCWIKSFTCFSKISQTSSLACLVSFNEWILNKFGGNASSTKNKVDSIPRLFFLFRLVSGVFRSTFWAPVWLAIRKHFQKIIQQLHKFD